MNFWQFTTGLFLLVCTACYAGDLTGHMMLVATFRTGNTEIFLVDPETGDSRNLTRSPGSGERYPAWSGDSSIRPYGTPSESWFPN